MGVAINKGKMNSFLSQSNFPERGFPESHWVHYGGGVHWGTIYTGSFPLAVRLGTWPGLRWVKLGGLIWYTTPRL